MAQQSFEQWLKKVDSKVENTVGIGISDLPDIDYLDRYEAGDTPTQAAKAALREAGWKD